MGKSKKQKAIHRKNTEKYYDRSGDQPVKQNEDHHVDRESNVPDRDQGHDAPSQSGDESPAGTRPKGMDA